MRRSLLGLTIASVLAAVAAPAAATSPGGSAVATCYDRVGHPIDTPQYAVCRGLQGAADAAAAACRMPLRDTPNPAMTEDCSLLDGRRVSEARVAAYRKSWVHRALSLQSALDIAAPLYEAQLPATHNSFNASSYYVPTDGSPLEYYPTLTNQDPNQVYSITDQLNLDVRGLEVDLHWVPSVYGSVRTGGYWVDVCHGQSTAVPGTAATVHVGCTADRSLQNTLAEIRRWLVKHPDQFLLIYLENQLDGVPQAHQVATSLLRKGLGRLVYTPPRSLPSGTCAPMPYDESPKALMAHGARVLLVGDCGPGDWNHEVFTRGPAWNESGNPTTYGSADCRADEQAHEAHTAFRRWYEESPFLEAATESSQTLTAAATARMVRCGVNLLGWDQLTPDDGRLAAFVWSWAPGQPAAAGRCAYQGRDGRFRAGRCGVRRPAACVDSHLDWHVTTARVPWSRAAAACRRQFPGSRFGVPPNGYRNAQLHRARPSTSETVWLDDSRTATGWRPGA